MLRVTIKWAARSLVAAACRARRHGPCTARVLTYHRIARKPPSSDAACVPERALRTQLAFIAAQCCAVAPSEVLIRAQHPTDKPRVCLTIDDGHTSGLDIAAPLLAELGLGAAFFVPTDVIGKPDHFSRTHIRMLAEAGFTIGSHGCSHRSMASLSAAEQVREARRSRRLLEDITGREVRSFAYPFGTRRDFDARTDRVLASTGYRLAFTSQHGPVTPLTAALRIPRVKVERTDSFRLFTRLAEGGLDAWALVDRWCWWLQRGRHRRQPAAQVT